MFGKKKIIKEKIEKKEEPQPQPLTEEEEAAERATLKKDERGHYIFSHKGPIGSINEPLVVGMPEYSTVLIYDRKNCRWLLTDGLGNGLDD